MSEEIQIEKRPGWDWIVLYRMFDDPPELLRIFGAMSVEAALRDAVLDLSVSELFGGEPDYEILGIMRADFWEGRAAA